MVQYDAKDGPCLRSFNSMNTVRVDLVNQGDVFPRFAEAARGKGFRGVLSVPATWEDEVVATLNLYSQSGLFDESSESIASILAAQVAIAVSRSPEFAAAHGVVEQAQRDADDHADINVATGLLIVNESCTAEQAEGLLRRAANRDERTILEIAQRIISSSTLLAERFAGPTGAGRRAARGRTELRSRRRPQCVAVDSAFQTATRRPEKMAAAGTARCERLAWDSDVRRRPITGVYA